MVQVVTNDAAVERNLMKVKDLNFSGIKPVILEWWKISEMLLEIFQNAKLVQYIIFFSKIFSLLLQRGLLCIKQGWSRSGSDGAVYSPLPPHLVGGSRVTMLGIRLDCCPIVCLSRPKLSAIRAKCCAQINYFQQEILLAGLGWSLLSQIINIFVFMTPTGWFVVGWWWWWWVLTK